MSQLIICTLPSRFVASTPGKESSRRGSEGQGDFHPLVIAQGKGSKLLAEGRPRLKSKKTPKRKDGGPDPINQASIKVD